MEQLIKEAKLLRDQGMGWVDITNYLNKKGYRGVKGKPYHNAQINRMVVEAFPELRTYKQKTHFQTGKKRGPYKKRQKTQSANDLAIELILKASDIPIKERLEIALKLI